jgi:transcriptional regulator with XRE-family HTH domain
MTEQPPVFGAELRRLRIAAGWTLGEFARSLHYSKGYLSKIETGEKPPSPDLARRCDTELQADGQLAALLPARPPRRSAAEPAEPAPGGAYGQAPGAIRHGDEVWIMSLDPEDGTGRFVPVNRRDALIAGVTSLLGLAVVRPRVAAAAGQPGTLAAFRSMFDQYRQLGQVMSPGLVLPALVAQTHAIRACAAAASGHARDRLLALAGRYAEYTGWMAQEAGDNRASEWWTGLAVELAAAGGDATMAAYAQVRRALVTLYQDDAEQTVQLAGLAAADRGIPARIRGLAVQRQAQGYALAGQEAACRRALDRAADLLAAAPGSAEPVIGSTTVADPVAATTGWCLYDLGRLRQSAGILGGELARIPVTAHRSQARYGARLALALADDGELDHACRVAHDTLDHAELVDSATVRVDLRRLSRRLVRWRGHGPVADLAPRLTAALHAAG